MVWIPGYPYKKRLLLRGTPRIPNHQFTIRWKNNLYKKSIWPNVFCLISSWMNSGRKLQRIPLSKKIKKTLNHLCKRKSLNILKYFEVPGVCSKRSVESCQGPTYDEFQNLRKVTKAWVTCWDFGGILHKDTDLWFITIGAEIPSHWKIPRTKFHQS